jgi:hypothetical protein
LSAGLIPTGSEKGALDASGTDGLPARRAVEVRKVREAGAATARRDLTAVRSVTRDDRDAIIVVDQVSLEIANSDRGDAKGRRGESATLRE